MEYIQFVLTLLSHQALIGRPSKNLTKMTFRTSNLLLSFLVGGYTIIKGVLDSTRPGLHNVIIKIRRS